MIYGGINKRNVLEFRDKMIEGMYVKIPTGEAKILRVYPHYAHTDKGNWSWTEIYFAEQGFVCEDRKKLIKEKQISKDDGE